MDQIVNLAMFTMDRTVTQSGTQRTPCDSQRRDARDTTACRPTSRVADMTARHLCRNTLAESVRHQR